MKRRTLLSLCLLAGLAVGGPSNAQVYAIATNPQGSVYYSAAAAMSKLFGDKLNLQFRAQPMAGSSTYLPLVNNGEIDFGMGNVDDLETGFAGKQNFEGKPNPNVRLMFVMFPLTGSLLVPADSPVKKVADVKGIRMPSGYASQTTGRVIQDGVLATAGLSTADIKAVPVVNLFAGVDALAGGRVDAAIITPGVAQVQKAHAELSSRGGVRFVSIETSPEAIARMKKVMPTRPLLYKPAPHFVGILEPTWMMGYSTFLFTAEKTAPELVYNIVKQVHLNHKQLAEAAPIMNGFEPDRVAEKTTVPWHPGAIKYLSEIGQWPPKD